MQEITNDCLHLQLQEGYLMNMKNGIIQEEANYYCYYNTTDTSAQYTFKTHINEIKEEGTSSISGVPDKT